MALSAAETALANQSLSKIGAKQYTASDGSFNEAQALVHFAQTRNALLRSFEWPFAKTRLRLVSGWLTDTVYTTDQYVWQSGLLYKCAVAHTSDTFATDLTSVYWTLQSTVSAWVTATAYALNDYVVNDAIYYRCILAHTSGDTDDEPGTGATYATYWVATTTKPTNVFGYNYNLPANSLRLCKNFLTDSWNWIYRHPHSDQYHRWELETNTILTDDDEVDIVYIDTVSDTTKWDALFTELFICHLAKKLLAPLAGAGPGTASLRNDLDIEIREINHKARTVGSQEGNNSGSSDWNNARYE